MDFQGALESITGIFLRLKNPVENSVRPAAPVENHTGPRVTPVRAGLQRTSCQAGGIFLRYMDRPEQKQGTKGQQQSPACPWTPASNTHRQSTVKTNQYRVMLCSGSFRYIWPWRQNETEEDTRRGRGERRPPPLPVVIRQLCCFPRLHNTDVLSPRDLLL